jgi:hypothetical protein
MRGEELVFDEGGSLIHLSYGSTPPDNLLLVCRRAVSVRFLCDIAIYNITILGYLGVPGSDQRFTDVAAEWIPRFAAILVAPMHR